MYLRKQDVLHTLIQLMVPICHRYCVEAHEAWGEVMEFLGCDIVVADKKTMKTFDIYKEAVNIRAEEKRAKKQDKLKLETQDEDQNYPRVFGLD